MSVLCKTTLSAHLYGSYSFSLQHTSARSKERSQCVPCSPTNHSAGRTVTETYLLIAELAHKTEVSHWLTL